MADFLELLSAESGLPISLIIIALVWSLIWKGIALWRAVKNGHVVWFVAFLVIHTLGILEILYVLLFSKIKFDDKPSLKKTKPILKKAKAIPKLTKPKTTSKRAKSKNKFKKL